MKLTKKETIVLHLALNGGVYKTDSKIVELWRTPHHRKAIFDNLETMGLIRPTESGMAVITEKGKETIGIEANTKLNKFVEE